MLRIALWTVRARWVAFVGSFVSLTLGVGLVATMGLALAAAFHTPGAARPGLYGAAPTVVRAGDVPNVKGRKLTAPRGLDPAAAARALALGGGAVRDRVFYAQVLGGRSEAEIGRPWSIAPFAPYRLVAGKPPVRQGEVVVPVGDGRPGATVRVMTAQGPSVYRVSGVVAAVGSRPALLFADTEAARLSPRIDAVVSRGPGGKAGDMGADADTTLDGTKIMLGTAGGICGFVAVFVVASTFALAVAQRRRELALLRALGATPRQVRRMLFAEALVVGVIAALLGCALGPVCAPLLGDWLVGKNLAPASYEVPVTVWPLLVAFGTGPAVSLLGVRTASRRAGRIRPAEALGDAAVETGSMTPGRWVVGVGAVASGLWMMNDPDGATSRKQYIPVAMMLIAGFAMLAPIIVPPLARLVTWPLSALRGAGAMVVRESTLTAARRTASTAAPVLVTVGLAASLLGATATIDGARRAELRDQHRSDFVVAPDGTPGLSRAVVDKIRAVPGVDTLARTSTTLLATEEGDQVVIKYPAQGVTPEALGKIARLPVVAGDPARLADDSIVVSQEWRRKVGERVEVWRADGSKTALRVVAVLRTGTGDNGVFVTPRNAVAETSGLADLVDVKLRPGTDRDTVRAALEAATGGLGARVVATGDWIAAAKSASGRQSRLGMYVVLGVALLYCAIAIANTLVMAAAARVRDQAVLRLAGATRRQVLRVVAAEALLVVAIGVVLATQVSALCVGGVVAGLAGLTGRFSVAVPWSPVGGVVAACAVIALAASVLPARAAMRARAVDALGTRE
ncbi:FtsX-like permease family protein [Actinomadura barringtoniae]|uniref:FtsX-like permease family protein n=1 Tax=Actinomadura barringtoniae TaxID=1427535 RepID=A0A939PKN3_9ACTN|nr:FtsX-like permease family protein [Actinomadura barringtoniae]MBO2451833.1 FtsX-like permease family protein [Actinomadura barringtoniae]